MCVECAAFLKSAIVNENGFRADGGRGGGKVYIAMEVASPDQQLTFDTGGRCA